MPDNFGRMTSDEAPQSLKDFTLAGIQGACIYINPEHIAAMPYTGGGKTPVYCATSWDGVE